MPINYWLKFGDTPLGYGSGGLSYASSQRYMRIQVGEGVNPTTWTWRSDVTLSQVASDTWDVMWAGNADQLCANMAILHVLESNFEGVTSASELFSGCTSLTSAVLSNTGGIQNMYRMFYNCTSLTSAPMFDTSGATSMRTMFSECSNLVSVPLYDTGNVTDMQYMFDRNKALTTVPLFDTSKVTNMMCMFRECSHLQSVPLFNTVQVTNMYGMFRSCGQLKNIPLFNTGNVTDMGFMCHMCQSIDYVPLFNTSKVTYVTGAFFRCLMVEGGALALCTQMRTQATPPHDHDYTFGGCGFKTTTGKAELAQIPSDWK